MAGQELPRGAAERLRGLHAAGDPQWRVLARALREQGYSLSTIGNTLGVSRQRIYTATAQAPSEDGRRALLVDAVGPRDYVQVTELLASLWALSSRRRGATRRGTLPDLAHRMLTEMVGELVRAGVPFDVLADAIGADRTSFRNRLMRAGVTRQKVRAGVRDESA